MGLTMTVLLFVAAFFCLALGVTAAASLRVPAWLAVTAPRPRLWGVGYTLFGATLLYRAVAELVHVAPAEQLVMTDVTPVTAVVGIGMGWLAQRPGRASRSPRTEPGTTK